MPLQNVLRNANKSLFGERPIIRPIRVEFLAVGGGGGGNTGTTLGSGGGAGGVITGSFCVQRDVTYDIIVGDGGAPTGSYGTGSPPFSPATANKGEDTVLFGVIALGGGAAMGGDSANWSRGNGGSGGGYHTGGTFGIGLQPTASYSGFGNNGASGSADGLLPGEYAPGGGGGAGTAANRSNAGEGISFSWLDDYTVGSDPDKRLFAQGGAGYQINYTGSNAPFDDGPNPRFPQYGKGGDGGFTQNATQEYPPREATSGSSGVVFIKYHGAPILQGGDSVVTNNGFTYHVFSTPGTGSLSFIPGKNQDNFALDNCNDTPSVPLT